MASSNPSAHTSGFFTSALTVLFIGLKLTGHIDWSWWWVLSPLWISALLALTVIAIVGIVVWRKTAKQKRKWSKF